MRSQVWNFGSGLAISLVILIGGLAPDSARAAGSRKPEEAPKATLFSAYSALESHAQELLARSPQAIGTDAAWQDWAARTDGHAAAFLAITRALELTVVTLSDGKELRALDLVQGIKEFKGDRIYVETRRELFEDWMESGGAFRLLREDGKDEEGHVEFGGGGLGGSLHKGYDKQGYTSVSRVPRIQWNYRFADAEADIDLDGYAPLKYGWIPNPRHKTWENSDPRFWLSSFIKKFGDPGFSVQRR